MLFFFSFWVLYFLAFWRKSLFFDAQGNLVAGHVNIWGDWAVHMTMTSAMSFRSLILQQSPLLLEAPFRYPFGANFLSAVLVRLGLDLTNAMVIISLISSIMFIATLLLFFNVLLKSAVKAVIASTLVLLNGGVTFSFFARHIMMSDTPLQTLISPPHEYTNLDEYHIRIINIIGSMIIPQRGFAIGVSVSLLALTLIIIYVRNDTSKNWKMLLFPAGLLLGFLPILHTHSFLMSFIVLVFWSAAVLVSALKPANDSLTQRLIYRSAPLLALATVVSLISVPLMLYFFVGPSEGSFINWYPGWYAKERGINWFWFWFLNWGLVPVTALVGLWIVTTRPKDLYKKMQNFLVYFPFFLIFILANFWLFQPFIWDNTKLIVWSSLGFAALCTIVLSYAWNSAKKIQNVVARDSVRITTMLLFASFIASGSIDAYWTLRHDLHSFTMFTSEELALAKWVKESTEPNSTWLTGDQHNHWLYNLTGRQPVMTYRGWMWTHGYKYRPIERDVVNMFRWPANNMHLFDHYNIDYVVIGPNELDVWQANQEEIESAFIKILETEHYSIYQTT